MGEVSADKAYLGHDNLAAIDTAGASAFIPFKLRASRHDLWKICGSSEDVMSTGPCKPTIPMYPMSCGIG
jgi:hypothetical protein